jgi:hypothetical protein
LRIACGSGGALPHLSQALEVLAEPGVRYAAFDLCAERTLAHAQLARLADPSAGFWPLLAEDMRAMLPIAVDRGIRLVGSWGQANPEAAGAVIRSVARELGLDIRVGVVVGDDVTDVVRELDPDVAERDGPPLSACPGKLVSAHAYLGAAPIVEALALGADVVVTGRCTDSALYLAPMIHELGWPADDWARIGRGVIAAHLLECAVQVTGGNFADPPRRVVEGLDRLPHPLADVGDDGSAEIFKPTGSGGLVSELTCRKQLVHEIADPTAYLTPDVTADFSTVQVRDLGSHRVRVTDGGGTAPPTTAKVLAAVDAGVLAIGEFSFAGPRAVDRARLAASVVDRRMASNRPDDAGWRIDLIGVDSIFGPATPPGPVPDEVRVRVALRTDSPSALAHFREEVDYQWLCVSGVSGVRFEARPALWMYPVSIPVDRIETRVDVEAVA